jgi:hypothetical protein
VHSVKRTFLILTMGLLSFLFSSCSKTPSAPLTGSIGPSPWAFRNRSFAVGGVTYRFRETTSGGKLDGLTSLQDAEGMTLLILDVYCYARILDDGTVLLWREMGEKAARRIVFDSFPLSSLRQLSDPLATAAKMREEKLSVAPLPISQHWELSPYLEAGLHPVSIPYDWSRFGETLVLADHADVSDHNKMARAIFAFAWGRRQVEVFPQDWYNTGDYDFGYQWITRVDRRSDGSIVGSGVRLGNFELDETNRQVKNWLSQDLFHGFQ